jgi:hypothetical protein
VAGRDGDPANHPNWGSAPIVRTLVQVLEAEGVTVEIRRGARPTTEYRDTRTIAEQVLINMVATGELEGIMAGVRKHRANFPRAKVGIEGEDDYGGPVLHTGRMD